MENKRTLFLTTQDLDLVLLEPSDASFLASWFNNPEVTEFLLRGDYPMTGVSEVEYLEKLYKDQNHLQLGIYHKESETLIGTTGLHRINAVHQTASFGIIIGDKSHWGKSYGTQTLTALLAYAFTRKNLRNVTLSVLGNNPRGKRCYEKCGFIEVGRYKNHIFKSGRWHDEILMICHNQGIQA